MPAMQQVIVGRYSIDFAKFPLVRRAAQAWA
jgi:hypothetical protein